jgi:transcriptional regulator with XRE-family HTH domain
MPTKEQPIYALPLKLTPLKPTDLPDIGASVRALAEARGSNMARVARAVGLSQSGLNKLLAVRNPRIGLLMDLSRAVQFNLMDMYLQLQPEHLRITQGTRLLQQQVQQLEQELAAVRAELEATRRERDTFHDLLRGRLM